uniref:Uncharacterized protein n=1 Tax=Kalanchoe fedtschenkoi TaxID=63787 RepID=A0A7N0RJ50_KALFE
MARSDLSEAAFMRNRDALLHRRRSPFEGYSLRRREPHEGNLNHRRLGRKATHRLGLTATTYYWPRGLFPPSARPFSSPATEICCDLPLGEVALRLASSHRPRRPESPSAVAMVGRVHRGRLSHSWLAADLTFPSPISPHLEPSPLSSPPPPFSRSHSDRVARSIASARRVSQPAEQAPKRSIHPRLPHPRLSSAPHPHRRLPEDLEGSSLRRVRARSDRMAWASAGRPRKRQIPVSSSALPYPGLPVCPVAIRLSRACACASRASELLERHASLGCCALVRMHLNCPSRLDRRPLDVAPTCASDESLSRSPPPRPTHFSGTGTGNRQTSPAQKVQALNFAQPSL